MTTNPSPPDWRGLCAELAQQLDDALDFTVSSETRRYMKELTGRARAALAAEANGPAVPEGREPASVIWEPSDEELLELMPETMRDEFSYAAKACSDATGNQVRPGFFRVCLNTAALDYARAVLARFGGRPAPAPAGEVAELVADLRMMASQAAAACQFTDAENLSRASDLLEQRQSAPVPVAVSERLPQPEDCDAEGRCWWFCFECPGEHPHWILAKEVYCDPIHCLPFHALPLPSGEVEA